MLNPQPQLNRGLVDCVVLEGNDPFDWRITHIQIDGVLLTRPQVVDLVKRNPGWIHTSVFGVTAPLIVASGLYFEYVTTRPDSSTANNLLAQRRCYYR